MNAGAPVAQAMTRSSESRVVLGHEEAAAKVSQRPRLSYAKCEEVDQLIRRWCMLFVAHLRSPERYSGVINHKREWWCGWKGCKHTFAGECGAKEVGAGAKKIELEARTLGGLVTQIISSCGPRMRSQTRRPRHPILHTKNEYRQEAKQCAERWHQCACVCAHHQGSSILAEIEADEVKRIRRASYDL